MASFSFSEQMNSFMAFLRGAPLPTPFASRVADFVASGKPDIDIAKDDAYFSVVLNEMLLASGREYWSTYDPMVVVTVEFLYNGKSSVVPAVIGPNLIKQNGRDAPHGFLINDELVVGPHPYRGGPVILTFTLYRVKHGDAARTLMSVVEKVSSAVGAPADLGLLAKVGGALIDGVETLIRNEGTVPVIGHRISFDGNSIRRGFRPGYYLIAGDLDLKTENITFIDGRIARVSDIASSSKLKDDYILYSIESRQRRSDESSLPFFTLYEQAVSSALAGDDESWKRAKSNLLALYGQMILSPDLVEREAEVLFDEFERKTIAARQRAQRVSVLSAGERPENRALKRLNSRLNVLDL